MNLPQDKPGASPEAIHLPARDGRNAGHWWQHEQAYERYDYLYQSSELEEWVPRIHDLARGADRLFITFNNHYQGQSITNARMMQRLLQD